MKCEICNCVNARQTLYCEKCGSNLYRSKLRVIQEDGLNRTHYLFSDNYTIGRGTDNDIVIPDASVSRCHAELRYENGDFFIVDKKSKNGSLLNNLQFKRSRLQNHDCIQLGNVVLHYYDDGQLLQPPSHFDTIEFVQKEYFKLAEYGHTNITTNDVLNTMLDLALSLVHADVAVILQIDHAAQLNIKMGKNYDNSFMEREWSLLNQVMVSQKPYIRYLTNGKSGSKTWPPATASNWEKIVFPLLATKVDDHIKGAVGRDGLLGVCYLRHHKQHNPITNRKKELLTALMQQIALALENELLHNESSENRRIRDEISSAKLIQEQLLPTRRPQIKELEVVSYVEPCATISGDYFDIIPISKELIGIAIGDICGKGVPAALLSSTAQAAIRSQVEYSTSPKQIVQNLNRLLIQSTTKSIFLTLFFGILNLKTNALNYINAGHMPPVFVSRDNDIRELSGTTPPLGILEYDFGTEASITFARGDFMLMYTDGLIENQNDRKQFYSRRRFLQLVKTLCKKTEIIEMPTLVQQIKDDFLAFIHGAKQTDDLTFVAVRRK